MSPSYWLEGHGAFLFDIPGVSGYGSLHGEPTVYLVEDDASVKDAVIQALHARGITVSVQFIVTGRIVAYRG